MDLPDGIGVSGSQTEKFSLQQERKPNDQVMYWKAGFRVTKLHIQMAAAYEQQPK